MNPVHWTPAVATLCGGLLLGVAYLFSTRRDRPAEADFGGDIEEAERRGELLIEQLRELKEERHKIAPEKYEASRTALESEAAGLLAQRDRLLARTTRARKAAAPPAATGWLAAHPQLKGALWGGGVVTFFALIGAGLLQAQTERTESGPMTGTVGGQARGAQAMGDPTEQPAPPKLAPEQIDELVRKAHQALVDGALTEANDLTNQVLDSQPDQLEAGIHAAALMSAFGYEERALSALGQLAERGPEAAEALYFQGRIARKLKKTELAQKSLARYLELTPSGPEAPRAREELAALRKGR